MSEHNAAFDFAKFYESSKDLGVDSKRALVIYKDSLQARYLDLVLWRHGYEATFVRADTGIIDFDSFDEHGIILIDKPTESPSSTSQVGDAEPAFYTLAGFPVMYIEDFIQQIKKCSS